MGAAVERLAAHVRSRLAGQAERHQHLAVQRALTNRVVAVIGQPHRVIRPHVQAVRAGKQPLPPGAQEIAGAVEHDHRVLAAVEYIDVVAAIDAD